METNRDSSFCGSRCLPLTPDSPLHPTLLPHVKEPIDPIDAPITPPSPAITIPTAAESEAYLSSSLPSQSSDSSPPGPSAAILNGLNVIAAERDALAHLHHVYATSVPAQQNFGAAVDLVAASLKNGGKLVVSGVGKSGKIGQKFVATANSLQILSVWLHPTEALHGDLGLIGPNDTILLLSYSSHSAELHHLLTHITLNPIVAVTGHLDSATNPLFNLVPRCALSVTLAAPVPVPEKALFGVSAPTTSTTVALAVCDALALALAEELHADRDGGVRGVFGKCHPGGAIGKTHTAEEEEEKGRRKQEQVQVMEMG